MNLKELLDRTLKEIDRQILSTSMPSPEQALIWQMATQELLEIRERLYRARVSEQEH